MRREAVATGREPELLADLAQIFREDEDADVRSAAARRVDDLEVLAAALTSEPEDAVRGVILDRLRHLAAAATENRAPLDIRQAIVAGSDDRVLLEAVAAGAPEPELRLSALLKVTRQGFLGDRAIEDSEPDIRRAAAAAVTQHSTLRRVIQGTRTSDKSLHQALAERLHRELLAAGDREAVDREALAVFEAVERAAINPESVGPEQVADFQARWAKLAKYARPEHQERFARDLARLAEPQPGTQPGAETHPPEAEQTETRAAPPPEETASRAEPTTPDRPPSAILVEVVQGMREHLESGARQLGVRQLEGLEKRWRQAWNAVPGTGPKDQLLRNEAEELLQTARAAIEAAAARRDELLEKGRQLMAQLGEELEQGELHKALESRLALQNLGKQLGRDNRWKAIQKQVNSMQGRLRELRGWQHWSNDKIRKRMIEEMEALPSAGLHPDAVLDRIKALQAQWKDLEQSEQIPGDKHFAAAPWMWRKFNAAGRKAFEATKPFLDKRTEIQKRHLEKMRALSAHIQDLADSGEPDWTELGRALARARREMRSLGEIPARARHKMAARLKAALEAGNTVMQSHYDEVEKKKLKLIREAAQLSHATDRDEAISTAKRLQAEWKAAGSLWRSRENQLWREFREPLDPLFENLKAERQSAREERDALLAEQKALCAELKEILQLEDDALAGQHGKIQGLQDSWKEVRHPDRRLQQEFQKLLGNYTGRLRDQERRSEQDTRDRWRTKADLLHEAEAAVSAGGMDDKLRARLEKAWPAVDNAQELEQQLDGRYAAALAGEQPGPTEAAESIATARKQCICLEFLAGIPSPDEEQELRMQYQVDRLSESLSGARKRMSAMDEAKMLESDWLASPFIPEPEYTAFRQRINTAVEKIYLDK